jgi:dihydrofolate reductase/thymidylate synthase
MPLKKQSSIANAELPRVFPGTFELVVAYTFKERGIGNQGKLAWHIPEDMAHFKEITTSNSGVSSKFDLYNIVVMGRKTWESIPPKYRPLEKRFNVVLSNSQEYIDQMNAASTEFANVLFTSWNRLFLEGGYIQLQEKIKSLAGGVEYSRFNYYIIGGAQIYSQALETAATNGNNIIIHATEIYPSNSSLEAGGIEAGGIKPEQEANLEFDTFFPKIDDSKIKLYQISEFKKSNSSKQSSSKQESSKCDIWYRFATYSSLEFYNLPPTLQHKIGKQRFANHEELAYLALMRQILETGKSNNDRTGVGTLSIFGAMLKYSLKDTFPISTTKRIPLRMIFEELMLYISGRTDNRILQEKGIHIWDGNTSREFLDKRGLQDYQEGDFGETYGFNMRHYGGTYRGCQQEYPLATSSSAGYGFDQLAHAINLIKTDPYSRRIIIDLWNPATQDRAALPSCLCKYQFNVDTTARELNLAIYLRSSDYFLANNWNTCTGALLVHLICALEGIDLTPGELTVFIADAHIYKSHLEQVRENLRREPYPFPKLLVCGGAREPGKKKKQIEEFRWEDIQLLGYKCHPSIKAEMAV